MEKDFPFCICNGGETITFLGITWREGVEALEADIRVKPQAGPPMHIHHLQDEIFVVETGKMAYQLGDHQTRYAFAGDTVHIPAGIPHKFWNDGKDLLICKGYVTPPGNFTFFLSELFKTINLNKGRPGLLDGAYLFTRYRSEYAMLEIPSFVRNVVLPAVYLFGILTGKYRKYAAAPLAAR